MRIATEERERRKPVTTRSGQVPDQAASIGVLNSLYGLHLSILSNDGCGSVNGFIEDPAKSLVGRESLTDDFVRHLAKLGL
jgi:hypothetical protein